MKFKRDEIGSSELCNVVGLYWTHPIKSFSQPVTKAIFRWLEQNEGSDVPRSHNLKNDLIDAHLKKKKKNPNLEHKFLYSKEVGKMSLISTKREYLNIILQI